MTEHLAILKKKYLDLILTGQKKIECRLTKIACPPFEQVAPNDHIQLKQSSGPIRAQATVKKVHYFRNLIPAAVDQLRRNYNNLILGDDQFWTAKKNSRYCSLIWLKNVKIITPARIKRKGLQAWIVQNQP